MWNFSFQPSACRAAGGLAFVLSMTGTLLISAGPSAAGKATTHFFELETCPLSSGGGFVLRTGSLPCPPNASSSRGSDRLMTDKLVVPLFTSELDPERSYHLVLLLPSDSHARLSIAATDARGRYMHASTHTHTLICLFSTFIHVHFPSHVSHARNRSHHRSELLPATPLELGPDESWPWREATNETDSHTSFAAASRRRLLQAADSDALPTPRERKHGRRLRGFGRIGGFGGFSRGTGSFRSPRSGYSMGPAAGGRVTNAYSRPSGFAGGGFAGGGSFGRLPGAGYNPGFGYHGGFNPGLDIATGLMIGSMLHVPHRHRHATHRLGGTTGVNSSANGAESYPRGTYLFAAGALRASTEISVVPSGTVAAPHAQRLRVKTRRTLGRLYDRYEVLANIRTPQAGSDASADADATEKPGAGLWPLVLRVADLALYTTTSSVSAAAPPTLYMSLQAAAPPKITPTSFVKRLGRAMQTLGRALMLALALVAWAGLRQLRAGVGASSELSAPAVGADGELLSVGARVQTQEPSSGEWYAGTVLALHDHAATVVYDDGEEWTGGLGEIYLLQDGDRAEEQANQPLAAQVVPLQVEQSRDRGE